MGTYKAASASGYHQHLPMVLLSSRDIVAEHLMHMSWWPFSSSGSIDIRSISLGGFWYRFTVYVGGSSCLPWHCGRGPFRTTLLCLDVQVEESRGLEKMQCLSTPCVFLGDNVGVLFPGGLKEISSHVTVTLVSVELHSSQASCERTKTDSACPLVRT